MSEALFHSSDLQPEREREREHQYSLEGRGRSLVILSANGVWVRQSAASFHWLSSISWAVILLLLLPLEFFRDKGWDHSTLSLIIDKPFISFLLPCMSFSSPLAWVCEERHWCVTNVSRWDEVTGMQSCSFSLWSANKRHQWEGEGSQRERESTCSSDMIQRHGYEPSVSSILLPSDVLWCRRSARWY